MNIGECAVIMGDVNHPRDGRHTGMIGRRHGLGAPAGGHDLERLERRAVKPGAHFREKHGLRCACLWKVWRHGRTVAGFAVSVNFT